MYDGIDMTGVTTQNPAMDWAFVDRLRKSWKGKFIIKGIDTREDARLCLEHGIDGILVSNHGGRSTETLRATIEALPEVVAEVGGRIPVFVDGGFRRGTDVFKALALGAKAVGIGRPMSVGLGSVRPGRRRSRARNSAGRAEAGDGQLRHRRPSPTSTARMLRRRTGSCKFNGTHLYSLCFT